MVLARSLDGVISGEHGIGITKLEFLTDDELQPFADYKAQVDPEGRFNKGKLLRNRSCLRWLPSARGQALKRYAADLTNAYTPSFGLMGHESLIMQQIRHWRDCRLGEGLPALRQVQAGVLYAHVPRANLLYSPRNKIWPRRCWSKPFCTRSRRAAVSSIKHWQEFEDVADHCTVCHKCYTPCPVKIDFGDVTMNMRNLLRKMDKKSFRPGNKMAMAMLNATDPDTIKLLRSGMVNVGFKAQRMAVDLLRKVGQQADGQAHQPRWARLRSRSR